MRKFLDTTGLQHLWGKFSEAMNTKQDKLMGAAGQVVGFDADGTATAVRGWSNLNLLDNAYWALRDAIVNQRGNDEYTGIGYTIDRWKTVHNNGGGYPSNLTVAIDDGCLDLVNNSNYAAGFHQILEDVPAGHYTLSILIESSNTTSARFFAVKTITGQEYIVVPVGKASGLCSKSGWISGGIVYINLFVPGNSHLRLKAAKLERGPVQTLAHQDADGNWVLNDPPPNKALELAKCQRYQLFGPLYGNRVWTHTNNQAGFVIYTPVSMAKAPSLVGTLEFRKNGEISNTTYPNTFVCNINGNAIYTYLGNVGNVDLIYIPQGSGFDANL